MFHYISLVLSKFYKRTLSLIYYIWDYKIIFFSLLYIIFDILTIKLLRNIEGGFPCKIIYLGIGGVLGCLFLNSRLRNILERFSSRKKLVNACRKLLICFEFLIYTFLIGLICLARNSTVIQQEKSLQKSAISFTVNSTDFWGYITKETVNKHTYDTVEVRLLNQLTYDGVILPKEGNTILVKIKKYQKIRVGEVCKFSGTFKIPENFEDFRYKDYLIDNNIFLILEFPKIECTGERKGFFLQNILVDFKQKLNQIIQNNLKEPQSSLLMGILFGQDRLFSEKFDSNIRIAGVSHIVAASGYNITILILVGNKLFKLLPYKVRIIALFLLIWAFCILSGLSPSIVRACIMTSISLFAMLLGRKNSIHIALPLAACIFTIVDPKIVFNVGFQLSVVATLGLIYLQPTLSHISEVIFKKKVGFLDNTLFPTLSCTSATFCITIPTFKTVSVWAIFANCLILPVIETTMLLGAVGILFSKISILISAFFFQIVNVQLKYFELVVNMIGSIKWGYWELENISPSIPIAIMIFLLSLCIYFYPVKDEVHNYYLKIFV